jgi:hypothetical protein
MILGHGLAKLIFRCGSLAVVLLKRCMTYKRQWNRFYLLVVESWQH